MRKEDTSMTKLISLKTNRNQDLVQFYLPYTQQKIRNAFMEWQESRALQTIDDAAAAKQELKASVLPSFHAKTPGTSNIDKQPFRPEQRYRRR
ncbi:hypothetical protein [Hymenobacter sp. YC55]|uniref:hypothetical protein n=1 Tax=Hymenobacter sp. YC55 TaxID=3034019 RepID=UPI0023F8D398|nr:hypothetical protein [Hymenobacter sp. YC55]MDF7814681.1 hypothetical protein [Hymenobacter sp. YC55]